MSNLQEKSDIYYTQADVYEAFSAAEDAAGLALAELLPSIKDKMVLDLGCGTGKYTSLLAPHAEHITGLDAAPAQLEIAKARTKNFTNVDFIKGDAAEVRLTCTYDVVLVKTRVDRPGADIWYDQYSYYFPALGASVIVAWNNEEEGFNQALPIALERLQ